MTVCICVFIRSEVYLSLSLSLYIYIYIYIYIREYPLSMSQESSNINFCLHEIYSSDLILKCIFSHIKWIKLGSVHHNENCLQNYYISQKQKTK